MGKLKLTRRQILHEIGSKIVELQELAERYTQLAEIEPYVQSSSDGVIRVITEEMKYRVGVEIARGEIGALLWVEELITSREEGEHDDG